MRSAVVVASCVAGLATACGGNVFVDGNAGSGGAGGTSSSSRGAGTASGTTTSTQGSIAVAVGSASSVGSATTTASSSSSSASSSSSSSAVVSVASSVGSGGSSGSGGSCPGGCSYPKDTCCGGSCVDTTNDPFNCNACGVTCPGPHPFCAPIPPSCEASPPCYTTIDCGTATFCCGTLCCKESDLCCVTASGDHEAIECVPKSMGTCPGHHDTICASPDTPIATPTGEQSIASLVVGDLVYSADQGGVRAVPVLAVQRVPAHHHRVVRVRLEGGATLEISPVHPTADGRTFGALAVGDLLDGQRVLEATLVPYPDGFTYDILPASDTGTYYAGGARIGSTMRR